MWKKNPFAKSTDKTVREVKAYLSGDQAQSQPRSQKAEKRARLRRLRKARKKREANSCNTSATSISRTEEKNSCNIRATSDSKTEEKKVVKSETKSRSTADTWVTVNRSRRRGSRKREEKEVPKTTLSSETPLPHVRSTPDENLWDDEDDKTVGIQPVSKESKVGSEVASVPAKREQKLETKFRSAKAVKRAKLRRLRRERKVAEAKISNKGAASVSITVKKTAAKSEAKLVSTTDNWVTVDRDRRRRKRSKGKKQASRASSSHLPVVNSIPDEKLWDEDEKDLQTNSIIIPSMKENKVDPIFSNIEETETVPIHEEKEINETKFRSVKALKRAKNRAERRKRKAEERKAAEEALILQREVERKKLLEAKNQLKTKVLQIECKHITQVPQANMRMISSYLDGVDIVNLSSTCTWGRLLLNDQKIWKAVCLRTYPQRFNARTEKNVIDWQLAYKLCKTDHIDNLTCFETVVGPYDDVLGVVCETSVNPHTRKIDYISPTMDLISAKAFLGLGMRKVRKTYHGIEFKYWLPLYISPGHFKRALPLLRKAIVRLCPHWRSQTFQPEMILDVLPKMMTTFSVLLGDKGIGGCRKAFDGFKHIHRVFLELVELYPKLKQTINERIRKFCLKEKDRHKYAVPSLGDWLPLLSVSTRYSWNHVFQPYLQETFARSVLWLGKAHPELASERKSNMDDEKRLKLTANAMRVRLRVTMFSVYFLYHFCRGSLQKMRERYDRFLGVKEPVGMPSEKKMIDDIAKIMEVETWEDIFRGLTIQCPPKRKILQALDEAVRSSYRRGYTRRGMNFKNVQKSGVSKILHRGETYAVDSKGCKKVSLGLGWTGSYDLDASVVLFDKDTKRKLEIIDYRHLNSDNFRITHSGDVVNGANGVQPGSDQERVFVNLQDLKTKHKLSRVNAKSPPTIIFVMSVYSDYMTCHEIENGFVRLVDDFDHKELCRFPLDSKHFGRAQAVAVCKLEYFGDTYKMVPIGEPLYGNEHYVVRNSIQELKKYLDEGYKSKDFIFK